MLQVLNKEERNGAFIKFLAFFLATVALILIAVYFDFKVPTEQNKKLLFESRQQDNANDNEEKFIARMGAVTTLLDSLDKPETNAGVVNGVLDDDIKDLLKLQGNANVLYDKLNKTLVDKFVALQQAKRSAVKNVETIRDLKKKLDDCQQNFENETKKNNMNGMPQQQGY